MSNLKLKRPSPGTALGLLALIVAVAGNTGAFAGTTHIVVRKGDIAKGAVTANTLAKGAVHAKALAKGAVTSTALKPGAVGAEALGRDAVTAAAIAPGSVYGGALGPVVVHGAAIKDLDETADLSTWTTSDTAAATCSPGERLLTGGVVLTNPGNRRVGIVEDLPFESGGVSGFAGQITSDSGGTAAAEVQAICLK
jgi:hypothetical protein